MPSFGRTSRLVGAALVAVPLAAAAAVGLAASSPAGAVTAPAAKGKVSCTKVSGKVTFNPPMTLSGSSSVDKEVAKVHVTVSGCTTSKGTPPSSGTSTAKIVTKSSSGKANACTGLETSRPVKLTVNWTTANPIAPSVVSFSGYKIVSNSAGDEGFSLPNQGGTASVSGSYPGKDGGATSTATVFSNKTATALLAACQTGLSSLQLTSGKATLK